MSILDPLYRHVNTQVFEQEAVAAHTNPALVRVANRIFRRHLNEGNPITWEQAKVDAERAWWDVHRQADVKQEQAS